MNKRVLYCVPPKIPFGSFDGEANIDLNLLVDSDGKVICVKALNGHPVLQFAAVKSVENWKFGVDKDDKFRLPFAGQISMFVSWDADKSKKQCEELMNEPLSIFYWEE